MGSERPYGWRSSGEMDYPLKNLPLCCSEVGSPYIEEGMDAAFQSEEDPVNWCWSDGFDNWIEIENPLAERYVMSYNKNHRYYNTHLKQIKSVLTEAFTIINNYPDERFITNIPLKNNILHGSYSEITSVILDNSNLSPIIGDKLVHIPTRIKGKVIALALDNNGQKIITIKSSSIVTTAPECEYTLYIENKINLKCVDSSNRWHDEDDEEEEDTVLTNITEAPHLTTKVFSNPIEHYVKFEKRKIKRLNI